MGTPSSMYLLPSATAIAVLIAAPSAVDAQSARGASVSLTVVVPSRVSPGAPLTTGERTTVLERTATSIDVETLVGLVDQPASRVEVRLGRGWSSDSTRVMVRNQRGELEALESGTSVVAVSALAPSHHAQPVQFRVAANGHMPTSVTIPVEYRVVVGSADQIAIWTVPSVIRVTPDTR